jgi:hypothetical protein
MCKDQPTPQYNYTSEQESIAAHQAKIQAVIDAVMLA